MCAALNYSITQPNATKLALAPFTEAYGAPISRNPMTEPGVPSMKPGMCFATPPQTLLNLALSARRADLLMLEPYEQKDSQPPLFVCEPDRTTRVGARRPLAAQRSAKGPGPSVHCAPVCSRKAWTASVMVSKKWSGLMVSVSS